MSQNKSAVILKADDLRAVSRRGIKLVTSPGGPEGLDSTMENMNEVFGVDIISGGKDHIEQGEDYLQPMVKGLKLQKSMREISKSLKKLNSNMMEIHNKLLELTGIVAKSVSYGSNAGGPVVCKDPAGAVEAANISAYIIQMITPELTSLAKELNNFETNFVEKGGSDSFLSKLNNVN